MRQSQCAPETECADAWPPVPARWQATAGEVLGRPLPWQHAGICATRALLQQQPGAGTAAPRLCRSARLPLVPPPAVPQPISGHQTTRPAYCTVVCVEPRAGFPCIRSHHKLYTPPHSSFPTVSGHHTNLGQNLPSQTRLHRSLRNMLHWAITFCESAQAHPVDQLQAVGHAQVNEAYARGQIAICSVLAVSSRQQPLPAPSATTLIAPLKRASDQISDKSKCWNDYSLQRYC